MKLNLTKHAFKRYLERSTSAEDDFYKFLNRLRQEFDGGAFNFLKWERSSAIYLNQALWRYKREFLKNEITLVTCLGVMEKICENKWERHVRIRSSRSKLNHKSHEKSPYSS